MFFDDEPPPLARKNARLKALPPIPETGWRAPVDFPRLGEASALSYDVETFDPELASAGPGWARGKGHIVGVSVGAIDRLGNTGAWYFPVRHELEPEHNLDPRGVFGWLKETLETSQPKVGANLLYDMGWLTEENIWVGGQQNDIQYAEALIDEEAYVGLDVLAHKYLNVGKTTDILAHWAMAAYNAPKTEWRRDIYRCSPRLVGPYGEGDAALPLHIIAKLYKELERQQLTGLFHLECSLIPLLIRMRQNGVSVDVEKAAKLKVELEKETPILYKAIEDNYGIRIESCSNGNLCKLFDHLSIKYPFSANGKGSFRKEFLTALTHPVGIQINDIREHEKMCGTFLQSYIIDKNVDGKIYPQFHPLKGDSNGTKVGRLASSDPNLQNIPARTKLGKRIRECFIPDRGHISWRKFDYSQIHYRILAHNAVDGDKLEFAKVEAFWRSPIGSLWGGNGSADALRAQYINDPDTDYHLAVYMNVAPLLGWSVTDQEIIADKRRPIKNVNFGLLYGQTEAALAYKAGFTGDQSKQFFSSYHTGAPYVRSTMGAIGSEVQQYGFVRTLLGRRIRFNTYEPNTWGRKEQPLDYDTAIRTYGSNIKRAFEYRGVNYKFQGSEPDIMKTGMINCYNSGVFDYVGYPRLTVHDELDFSVKDDCPQSREAYTFIRETMQSAIRLRVPVKVDVTTGENWAKAK